MFMTRIDDLDADTGAVNIGNSAPVAATGMPGAVLFLDHVDDLSVFTNDIVGGNLGFGIGQLSDRQVRTFHASIVHHQNADRQSLRSSKFGDGVQIMLSIALSSPSIRLSVYDGTQ